jgi:hypothetical protein
LRLVPRVLALVPTIAILVAGCGSGPSPTASPTGSAATVSPSVAPSATATAGSTVGSPPLVAVEPGLLSHVPAALAGIALTFDPDTTARVAADPGLGRDASALAMAIAASPGSSSEDLAVVSVIRLRDPTVGEPWFRTWRDSYDAAACGSAGGVAGHAQATIHDRVVFIGSCAGGAFTYHVRLTDGPFVVSAISVGPLRLGEKLMEGIVP